MKAISDYSSTRGGLDGHVSSEDPYIQVGYSHHHSYSQAFNNVDDNKNNVDEINGSDNITDDDDTLEPDIIFSPWRNPYFEPYLGPFEALPDQSSFSIWANMLQQKLKSMIGIDTGNITTPQQQFQQQHRAKGLTIDYLQYYVDQSHVGVVRTLHFIFILLPFGSFEELSRNRDMIPTMTPLPEYGRVSSTPGVQSFFNIFNPIKPPLGSALEKAHQTYDTIREVKIGGPNDVGKWSAPGVVSILLCLKKIRVLDMTEWREAINYLDMIPTQDLKTLLLGDVRMTYNRSESMGSDQHHDTQIWALQNCRQLQELRMPVLIDGLFEWAVQERKSRLDSYSQSTHPRSFFSTTSDWIDDLAPVQLKNIHLTGSCTSPLITTLLHVVDAFRDSIQVLQSTSWIDSTETRSYNQSLAWTWCLPNLHVLDLQGEIAYLFRIQSLESCPQLRVLRLVLPHSFLPPSSSSSSLLSKTEELAMESLNSFPCSSPTRRTCAFHSRGDLRRRQRQLHYTSLADVLGDDDEYNSEDDSSCTCDNIQSNTNSHKANASVPYVSSSSHRLNLFSQLKELKLVGDWGLANESLLGIAKKMPRLERLSLLRCESNKLTAQGLIRAMPSLRRQQRHQSSSDLDIVYDNDPTGGRYSRVRWIEICKSWQREIEAAMVGTQKLDINKSDGASFNEQQQQYLRAFEAAVKEGVSPLQIVYSY
ncbi:hypothetical protein FBU30_006680 [Linnemannia zychae]|nr:hypothetical protein FBU30_006680 [Linnemannia zychae]